MLTSPNVIVPDQNERTGAPAALPASAAALLCLRLGNFLLLRSGDTRAQAVGETCLGAFFFGSTGSSFSPRALASISLHRRSRYSFCHSFGIEIGCDGCDELLAELQLVGLRRDASSLARRPRNSTPDRRGAASTSSR